MNHHKTMESIAQRSAENIELLSDEFLAGFPDFPEHMNALGRFVFLRTYSRLILSQHRRETYKEVCTRVTGYSVGLEIKHLQDIGYTVNMNKMRTEAELLFTNMFNLRQYVSGRSLWIGGTKAAEKTKCGNFNCSFLNIKSWSDLGDLFYMLLVGTGVGFKCTKKLAKAIPKIRISSNLVHSNYYPLPVHQRLETSHFTTLPNGFAKIYIGDSKEGWVSSLRYYFELLTDPQYEFIHTIKLSYNSVRPHGERLKTFGGQASGHLPLQEMFQGIHNVLQGKLDDSIEPIIPDEKGYGCVRPIHVLDIGNLIGYNVVVGGVRRTAELNLFDQDDYEILFAKYGINGFWTEKQVAHHKDVGEQLTKLGIKPKWFDSLGEIGKGRFNLNHRRMSNNSIAFNSKPDPNFLALVFNIMQSEGEPGFINLEAANKRRPHAEGINPCAEIILDSYGMCNLTTVNMVQFVKQNRLGPYLDIKGLYEAQRLSARCGLRMTLVTLELPHWDVIQKRDRLLGTSLTGVKDAMDVLGYTFKQEEELISELGKIARNEADRYAKELRVNSPLLVTTVKPEGSLSQISGGVSCGLHLSHSPFYIRRIRINAADPLAKTVKELGWIIHPEVGTPGNTHEEKMKNARTLVIDFPVASGAKKTKFDTDVKEQLETYFSYQRLYTEHNSSNTITVRPEEWDTAREIIYANWDDFVGVSFLQLDGGSYELAPYEACDEKTYLDMVSNMKPFDMDLLIKNESEHSDFSLGKMAGACSKLEDESSGDTAEIQSDENMKNDDCVGGVCPIR